MSTISNLVHRASINGKNYDYEFGFLAHIGNILIDAALGLLNLLFCIPELATGLIAGTLSFIALHLYNKGNTAQRLCGRCTVDFFVRLYKNDAGILTYVKEFLCKMTGKAQADDVQSRQACFVRCCLKTT